MESHSEENATIFVQAQTHVWKHIFNFINSMSLKCANDLKYLPAQHFQNYFYRHSCSHKRIYQLSNNKDQVMLMYN